MTLVLLINGLNQLENGEAARLKLDRHGARIGRSPHMDWSLPDPRSYISSTHCEIEYRDGGYVLVDKSTNGTFVNRSSTRLAGPHNIADGDVILVGHYEIVARLEGEGAAGAASAAPAASAWGGWDSHVPAGRSALIRPNGIAPRPSRRSAAWVRHPAPGRRLAWKRRRRRRLRSGPSRNSPLSSRRPGPASRKRRPSRLPMTSGAVLPPPTRSTGRGAASARQHQPPRLSQPLRRRWRRRRRASGGRLKRPPPRSRRPSPSRRRLIRRPMEPVAANGPRSFRRRACRPRISSRRPSKR